MQGIKGLMVKKIFLMIFALYLFAEPIRPVPKFALFDKNKALLGKMLFFDPILSRDNKISCVSCHMPSCGGADCRQFSIGVYGRIDRPMNSPTVYNAVFNCWQFWNGRAKTLAQQAEMANHDKDEMDMDKKTLEKRMNSNPKYKALFKSVYKTDYITDKMVYDAIAEFEKALITPNCRFDRYLRGEKNVLNEKEKRGYFLFKAYGCITCHNGVNLGGNSFQKLGIFIEGIKIPRGLDRYYVTKREDDKYVYKVPTLRNIALTAPYFHDGSISTLKEAIVLMGKNNLGIKIPPKDVEDIEAFLKTLTGEEPEILKNDR
jgi:cytochrome c peroxidase